MLSKVKKLPSLVRTLHRGGGVRLIFFNATAPALGEMGAAPRELVRRCASLSICTRAPACAELVAVLSHKRQTPMDPTERACVGVLGHGRARRSQIRMLHPTDPLTTYERAAPD